MRALLSADQSTGAVALSLRAGWLSLPGAAFAGDWR